MIELLGWPFDTTGFVPRQACGDWSAPLMWAHVASDFLIWFAYVSIPVVLLWFARHKQVPFQRVFVLFAAFILACGTGHLIEAVIFFEPFYRLAAIVKVFTAAVSLATVLALIPIVRRLAATDLAHLTAPENAPGYGRRGVSVWVTVVFATAVVVLVANTALASYNINVLIFNEQLVAHTRQVKQELADLQSSLSEAETGHRGYVITGQQPYLAPYHTNIGEILHRLDRLDALIADNPDQVRDAAVLRELATDKLAEMARVVKIFDTEGREAARAAISQNRGLSLMQAAQSRIADMTAREDTLLDDRANSSRNKYRATTVTNLFGGLLAFAMLGLGYGIIRWEFNRRVLAEAALQESERTLRAFYDSSPLLMGVVEPTADGDIRHLYDNEASCRFFRTNPGSSSGWRASELGAGSTLLEWRKRYEEAARVGTVRFESRHESPDGPRWLAVTVSPLGKERDLGRFCYVAEDITERQRAAAALAASESRFRTLTEAVPLIVWTADPRGEVNFYNRRWEQFTGYTLAQRPADGWTEIIHPDDYEAVYASWNAAVTTEAERFAAEFRLRRKADGAYRWMLSTAVPLRNEEGRLLEWVGSITDIDDQKRQTEMLEEMVTQRTAALQESNASLVGEIEERKRAEEQVRAVATELSRSNGELEQFAYVASHDLQEPLRKIQAFGDRLKTKVRNELPEIGKDYIDRMLQSAGRMRRLIDDLLSFSRVASQARPFAPTDLGSIATDVVADLDVRTAQSRGYVDVGTLPTLDADPSQMRQLFQNLITNGLKFQKLDVPPIVEIRSEPARLPTRGDGGTVPAWRITVADNGIGFDEKYLDRIFQVFQRLHGRDEYEGTGVGLAICRKIVDRHGGTLTATSRPGHGATFIVTLPTKQTNTDARPDAGLTRQEIDHDPDGRRRSG